METIRAADGDVIKNVHGIVPGNKLIARIAI
jgi:hypothetical protein